MSNNQFHVVLPSNASGDIYKNNTVSSYKTHLSQPITLNGSWQISLLELLYPITWMTLEANEWFQLVVAHEHVGGPKLNSIVAVILKR